jgi:hypothetical protein
MTRTLTSFLVLVLLALASPVAAQVRDYASVKMKTVDSGLGFTFAIPEPWVVGTPSGNNKFQAGGGGDDFAVIITDFGPVAKDAAAADAVYRDSFTRSGFVLKSAANATVAGVEVKRYVFSVDSDSGEGHLEVVMLPVGAEMYSVMVATPASEVSARRDAIEKIIASLALKP